MNWTIFFSSEKDDQYEYMVSVEKRKEHEYENRIVELTQEQEQAQVWKLYYSFMVDSYLFFGCRNERTEKLKMNI